MAYQSLRAIPAGTSGTTDRHAMGITLQSTVSFSAEFINRLPELEQAMIAHGLEPQDFVISKDYATPSSMLPLVGPYFYAYTVFIGDENFTVTEPNDATFYEFFYKRCIAEEETSPAPARGPGLIRRLFRWMDQPI